MIDPLDINRAAWNTRAPQHVDSEFYGVERFLDGELTLKWLERELCGSVAGLDLLHLQCHFGLDTLSWARLGARATGVDFSDEAIRQAANLARRSGLMTEFIEADVTRLPDALAARFDLVVSTYGALCWLPDLEAWAAQAARCLRPGGRIVVVEFHPVLDIVYNGCISRGRDYFCGAPRQVRSKGTYAKRDAPIEYSECLWQHPVSEPIARLIDAGFTIGHFAEHPFCSYPIVPELDLREGDYWRSSVGDRLPFLYSIVAKR